MASVIRGDDNFDSAVGGNTGLGEVCTYVCAMYRLGNSVNFKGSTTSGSNLVYHETFYGASTGYLAYPLDPFEISNTVSSGLSGTWRCMGNMRSPTTSGMNANTAIGSIWLRIS